MLSGSSAEALLRIIFTAVLARLLSPGDFGLLASAMVVISFADLFSQFGFGPAIVQREKLSDRMLATSLTVSVALGFVFMALFWVINPFISTFFRMPDLTQILNVLIILFPLRSATQISYALLQRNLDFKRLAGLDVLSYTIGYGLIGIGLALSGHGVWSLVYGVIAQAAIYCALVWSKSIKYLSFGFNYSDAKTLAFYGLNFTSARFFNFIALKGDYFIIGKYLGDAQLGFYSRAYGLMNAPNSIVGKVLNNVLFASFSKVQSDKSRLDKGIQIGMKGLFMFILPVSIWCFFLAEELVLALLGNQWKNVVIPFQVLTLGMVFRLGYKIGGSYLRGTGYVVQNSLVQILYALLVIFGVSLTVYLGGSLVQIAWSIDLALFITFLYTMFYVVGYSGYTWRKMLAQLRTPIIYSLLLSLVLYAFSIATQNWLILFRLGVSSIFLILACVIPLNKDSVIRSLILKSP
ncbi:MAG: lipopolysaccharide biosynthesis protein [Bacteroidota bacterium]